MRYGLCLAFGPIWFLFQSHKFSFSHTGIPPLHKSLDAIGMWDGLKWPWVWHHHPGRRSGYCVITWPWLCWFPLPGSCQEAKHKQFTQQPALKQSESLEGCQKILCTLFATFCKSEIISKQKAKKITLGEIYIYFVQKRKTTWFCTSYYFHVNSTSNMTVWRYWDAVTTTVSHRQLVKRHVLEVWTAFQTTCASLLSYPRALCSKGGFRWRKWAEAGRV